MSARHLGAMARLGAADERLARAHGPLPSLCAGRRVATRLVELGEALLTDRISLPASDAFSRALCRMVDAQSRHFPDNLFWDFDYAAARLLAAAVVATNGVHESPEAFGALVARLQERYGMGSRIQFRYAHDFLYGFDWARWVRRDPEARAGVAPLDGEFLRHLDRRADELLALIVENDAKYPALPAGAARNPFGFARDPASEGQLHRDLAERGLIPVEAWRIDATPRWDADYAVLREERARALGLATG